jgi:hypothetical protein
MQLLTVLEGSIIMFLKIRFYGNVLSVTSNEADKTDAERVTPNINNGNV